MKKQIISLLVLICACAQVFAQVAINADGSLPDNSAILDVKSTTQGLLVPRLNPAQRLAIPNPASGLLVYQKSAINPGPGFYYNAGDPQNPSWFKITATDPSLPVSQFWDLTGNQGTNPAINFIGTTDDVPLVFKVNNELSGKIDHFHGNTSFGFQALKSISAFEFAMNTAVGYQALVAHKTGSGNTAIGFYALGNDTTGGNNTAIGVSALGNNTHGYNNTAIGDGALAQITTGNNNIGLGGGCGTSGDFSNTISIGNYYYPNNASNQTFIGDGSMGWIGGHVTWSTYSDARIKNSIREDVKGLDFVMRLRPVTYHKSIKAISEITGNKQSADYPEKYDVEKVRYSGFLAQEVEQAARESGYDFSGIKVPTNSNELYSLSYEQFVVPLVKAVQEQQAIIGDLGKRVENLEKSNTDLMKMNFDLMKRLDALESRK